MTIRLEEGLPYVSATLTYRGHTVTLAQTLLDTGSAGTIFSVYHMASLGLVPEPDDPLHQITGVGGTEFVFAKRIDSLTVGDLSVNSFVIEIGAMDYDLDLDGIVGIDFLVQTGAVIDLVHFEIRRASS